MTRRPRPPGLASASTARPIGALDVVLGPLERLDLAGVDVDHGDVEVRVGAGTRPVSWRPSAKVTVDLVVPEVVGVGQDPARAITTPEPPPQPRPSPTTAGPKRSAAVWIASQALQVQTYTSPS